MSTPTDNPSVLAQVRKAIAGVVTPVVTYAVTKYLHGSDELAIALAAAITGEAVYLIKNELGHLHLP